MSTKPQWRDEKLTPRNRPDPFEDESEMIRTPGPASAMERAFDLLRLSIDANREAIDALLFRLRLVTHQSDSPDKPHPGHEDPEIVRSPLVQVLVGMVNDLDSVTGSVNRRLEALDL